MKISKQAILIVLEKLKCLPNNVALVIGDKTLTRDELIKCVEEQNEIGKDIVQMKLLYLKSVVNRGQVRE